MQRSKNQTAALSEGQQHLIVKVLLTPGDALLQLLGQLLRDLTPGYKPLIPGIVPLSH
jgi:hypothetical protein